MSEHMSVWDSEGAYGPVTISCTCGQLGPHEVPDAETAGDVWGDHMYEVGFAEGRAQQPQQEPQVQFFNFPSGNH